MPIAINGSGSVTGLSVGGLPDGTVDRDTLATNAKGSILQVLQTLKTDTFTTTSYTFTDVTGLSIAITPSSTSSKILVQVHLGFVGGDSVSYSHFQLVRGSTAIGIGTTASGSNQSNIGFGANWNSPTVYSGENASFQLLDSPNTTSATTYKLQMRSAYASKSVYVNRTHHNGDEVYHGRSASTITVMEVAV
tara:strand:+ start:70 stop:645 length:576 start_codon:yes stop_codon:yes gene_type:complete